jgi:hypothetical protein
MMVIRVNTGPGVIQQKSEGQFPAIKCYNGTNIELNQ